MWEVSRMKREPWLSSLLGIALGVCMAVGAMGCLASAFELNIEYPSRLLLIWTAGSALCALLWRWRWGDLPVLLAVGLGMGYLLRRGELVEQLRQLIYRITYIYDQAYQILKGIQGLSSLSDQNSHFVSGKINGKLPFFFIQLRVDGYHDSHRVKHGS